MLQRGLLKISSTTQYSALISDPLFDSNKPPKTGMASAHIYRVLVHSLLLLCWTGQGGRFFPNATAAAGMQIEEQDSSTLHPIY